MTERDSPSALAAIADSAGASVTPNPQTLANQLAEQLGLEIAFRRLAPGTRIREVELAKHYNVSRPLVREVIRRLEEEGLLEKAPWRGARIPMLSETQLSDLFEFGALVFGFCCRLAAQRATSDTLAVVTAAVEKLARVANDSNSTAEEYERVRMQAHGAILRCMGDSYELAQKRHVGQRIRHQFAIDSVRTPDQRHKSAGRWRVLLEHLQAGDSVAAEAHAQRMMLAAREPALAALKALDLDREE